MSQRLLTVFGPQNAPAEAFYIGATHQDLVDFGGRYRRLPPIASERRSDFLAEYTALAEAQIAANADQDAFWYTALATKNTWHSCLYIGLEHLWRLDRLLADGGMDIAVVARMPQLCHMVAALARSRGWQVRDRSIPDVWATRLKESVRGPVSAFRYLATLCNHGLGPRDLAVQAKADLILASVFLPQNLKNGRYRDVFFGMLLDSLLAAGKTPLLFGQISGHSEPFSRVLLQNADFPIRSLVHCVDRRDVLAAVLKAAATPLRAAPVSSVLGLDVMPLVAMDIKQGRWHDITVGLLIETALARLLEAHPGAQLMHIYENNRWELACRRAADRCGRSVTGYQHNAVIPAHLKMQAIPGRSKPFPDRIITSGPAARDILVAQMRHDPAKTFAGCALRIAALPPTGTYQRSGQLKNVLVLLQGLVSLPQFYDALQEAFGAAGSGLRVTLRPHPEFTVEQTIGNTGLKLQAPFVASREPSLLRDLLQHDVVVYGGSTAAMEAVGIGVPAVHLDLGDPVDVNPLFAEPALSERVEDPRQLLVACRRLAELPASEYAEQAARARAYVEGYFAAPTEARVSLIMSLALQPRA